MFFGWLIALETEVALMGLFAWSGNLFTEKQMLKHHGPQGLVFIYHGGIWGDVIIISPLVAAIVECCGSEWLLRQKITALIVGFVASVAMHQMYTKIPWPDALMNTKAWIIHMLYTALAIAAFFLYFIWAPFTPWMWLVSGFIVIHVAVGNHAVLGLLHISRYPGKPFTDSFFWIQISGVAVLTFGVTTCRALKFW
ncbi:MAG: hypothetical protein NTU85_02035 [Candidatus Kaiserbacteria bacterium]|nr:hypothetical protein [Candidatus Kaiserbacteria bacterium]